jgi:hypothetical protein
MSNQLAIDIISDLHLDNADAFDWENKPTALFCVIPGGVSSDLQVLDSVLEKLSRVYRGVFYIDGPKDHANLQVVSSNVDEITKICSKHNNVVYLHNHVVIMNSIAFIGVNGWFKNHDYTDPRDLMRVDSYKMEDIAYLSNSIKTIKTHSDVEQILVISACVPAEDFLYRSTIDAALKVEPAMALFSDNEFKAKNWVFGGSKITVDTIYNKRRFVNNPQISGQPYWPKRILL